jgi:hypothetical protein
MDLRLTRQRFFEAHRGCISIRLISRNNAITAVNCNANARAASTVLDEMLVVSGFPFATTSSRLIMRLTRVSTLDATLAAISLSESLVLGPSVSGAFVSGTPFPTPSSGLPEPSAALSTETKGAMYNLLISASKISTNSPLASIRFFRFFSQGLTRPPMNSAYVPPKER